MNYIHRFKLENYLSTNAHLIKLISRQKSGQETSTQPDNRLHSI
jgi:hypothetical protein